MGKEQTAALSLMAAWVISLINVMLTLQNTFSEIV